MLNILKTLTNKIIIIFSKLYILNFVKNIMQYFILVSGIQATCFVLFNKLNQYKILFEFFKLQYFFSTKTRFPSSFYISFCLFSIFIFICFILFVISKFHLLALLYKLF